MLLKLINNLTKNTVNIGEIEDKLESNLFYTIDIELPDDMTEGEYVYELYDNDMVVSRGLLQIGDYNAENKVYKEEKTYIVYG
jgi:hypothetical protein